MMLSEVETLILLKKLFSPTIRIKGDYGHMMLIEDIIFCKKRHGRNVSISIYSDTRMRKEHLLSRFSLYKLECGTETIISKYLVQIYIKLCKQKEKVHRRRLDIKNYYQKGAI